jgi:hypothetical protein
MALCVNDRSHTLAALIIPQSVMHTASPPHLILMEISVRSTGDLVEVTSGSMPPPVVNPEEPVLEEMA